MPPTLKKQFFAGKRNALHANEICMQPRTITATRIRIAYAIAACADVIQIPLNAAILSILGAPLMQAFDIMVDIIVMALVSKLLGFHWAFLPTFVAEAVPGASVLPTWTACVAFVVWRRRQQAQASLNAPESPHGDAIPIDATPSEPASPANKRIPMAARMFSAQTSGLWMVVITASLIGGWFLYKHRHDGKPVLPPWPDHIVVPSPPGSSPVFDVAPNPNPGAKPVIVIAPVENQVSGKKSRDVNPERIRAVVEDAFASMEAVTLAPSPPPQVRQPVIADLIAFVTVLEMYDEAAAFRGYGIAANTLATKCSFRLQLVNVANKTTVFSAVLDGSNTDVRTAAASAPVNNDRVVGAIRNAIKQMTNNTDFATALRASIQHQ
jgi:hypothetical protein